jgi:hypothetical protein
VAKRLIAFPDLTVAHTITIVAACLAVFAASALGLNQGMVVCTDGHGRLAVESAHVRHAHAHGEGADHEHHECPEDAEHAELHAALADCSDFSAGQAGLGGASSDTHRLAPSQPLPVSADRCPVLKPRLGPAGTAAGNFRGVTARAELGSLGAVILLV